MCVFDVIVHAAEECTFHLPEDQILSGLFIPLNRILIIRLDNGQFAWIQIPLTKIGSWSTWTLWGSQLRHTHVPKFTMKCIRITKVITMCRLQYIALVRWPFKTLAMGIFVMLSLAYPDPAVGYGSTSNFARVYHHAVEALQPVSITYFDPLFVSYRNLWRWGVGVHTFALPPYYHHSETLFSPYLLWNLGLPNLVFGYIQGRRYVAYHSRSLWPIFDILPTSKKTLFEPYTVSQLNARKAKLNRCKNVSMSGNKIRSPWHWTYFKEKPQ